MKNKVKGFDTNYYSNISFAGDSFMFPPSRKCNY